MEFTDRIRDRVVPAVPVPFDASGEIDTELQDQYVAWMADQAVGGGRGVGAHRPGHETHR